MEVKFTQMAENCLQEIESFAIEHFPENEVSEFVDGLVIRNYEAICENPTLYRYNKTLLDFGIKFRERIDNGYRCLYEIENDTVFVMLFLRTKQDLISALYRHQVIRD